MRLQAKLAAWLHAPDHAAAPVSVQSRTADLREDRVAGQGTDVNERTRVLSLRRLPGALFPIGARDLHEGVRRALVVQRIERNSFACGGVWVHQE
jgi:hypothetical protein